MMDRDEIDQQAREDERDAVLAHLKRHEDACAFNAGLVQDNPAERARLMAKREAYRDAYEEIRQGQHVDGEAALKEEK